MHVCPHCCPSPHTACSVPRTDTGRAAQTHPQESPQELQSCSPHLPAAALGSCTRAAAECGSQDKRRKAQLVARSPPGPICCPPMSTGTVTALPIPRHLLLQPHLTPSYQPQLLVGHSLCSTWLGGSPRAESPAASSCLRQGIQRQHGEEEGEAARG